jgi:hypothetical protein
MSILVQNQPPAFDSFSSNEIEYTQYWSDLERQSDLVVPVQFTAALSPEGIGGTYILSQNEQPFAVFKPADEEPGCPNNPKNQKNFVKEGVLPGEGAIREYLAYLLDIGNYARVPETKLLDVCLNGENKFGSLQEYIINNGTMDDFGSSLFTIEDVQRLAQFDIRTLNMDRNLGNMLVVDSGDEKKLIPIDHSYILPEKLDGAIFDWMYWGQADKPVLQSVKEYVRRIDVEMEVSLLEMIGVSREAVENFKIASLFLKKACEMNWSFRRMAQFVCKIKEDEKTKLELIVGKVKLVSSDQQSFWYHFMDELNTSITE